MYVYMYALVFFVSPSLFMILLSRGIAQRVASELKKERGRVPGSGVNEDNGP